MQRLVYTILMGVVVIGLIGSCVYHEAPEYTCPDTDISYDSLVHPIVMLRCAIDDCHNGENGAEKDWRDFAKFQAKAQTGILKQYVLEGTMPPPDSSDPDVVPLTASQVKTIVCWIDQGAKDN